VCRVGLFAQQLLFSGSSGSMDEGRLLLGEGGPQEDYLRVDSSLSDDHLPKVHMEYRRAEQEKIKCTYSGIPISKLIHMFGLNPTLIYNNSQVCFKFRIFMGWVVICQDSTVSTH
jgi:hypothetical protein